MHRCVFLGVVRERVGVVVSKRCCIIKGGVCVLCIRKGVHSVPT